MQEYVEIPRTKSLRDSRELITRNDLTVASHYAGPSFPAQYLVVGMECYRTDLKAKYRLTKTEPITWEPVLTTAEIAKVKVDNAKNADYAANAGKVNGYTVAKDVPANAVFTDTWRPVEDRLTSTSPINALSALQGKLLNEQKAPLDNPKLTGKPTAPTPPLEVNDNQIATAKFVHNVVADYSTSSHGTQFFTTNGTWIAPAGVTGVTITAKGGGGGGGGAKNGVEDGNHGGNGGSGGVIENRVIQVTPGMTYSVTIGVGGTGGTGTGDGRAGSATSFSNLISIGGGGGGIHTDWVNRTGANGANGSQLEGAIGSVFPAYGNGGAGVNESAWGGGHYEKADDGGNGVMMITW